MLGEPELLNRIVSAVRTMVPVDLPFTAKMRLGIDDTNRAVDCAQALAAGGIDEVVLAMNATLEGQTTMHYLAERLAGSGAKSRANCEIPVHVAGLNMCAQSTSITSRCSWSA